MPSIKKSRFLTLWVLPGLRVQGNLCMIPPMLFIGSFAALRSRVFHHLTRNSRRAFRHALSKVRAYRQFIQLLGPNSHMGPALLACFALAILALFSQGQNAFAEPSISADAASSAPPLTPASGPDDAGSKSAARSFAFDITVKGTKLPDEIKAQVENAVSLGKGEDAARPTTLGQLRRRANEEAKHLTKVLRSQAYFKGRIEPVIEEAQGGRFQLIYRVTLGARTMIETFKIIYVDHPSDEASLPQDATPLGLKPGRAARAQRILNLTADALTWLENHGHPTPTLEAREVIVDLATDLSQVTLKIKAGEPRYFAPLRISNATKEGESPRTDPAYINELATFTPGDLYDRREADATVAALRGSNLFDEVSIDITDGEGNRVTPDVSLTERAPRSVGVGASWSSDEGAGVRGFWEHRNLFGRAEKLRLEISVAQTTQSAKADFTKPRFLRPDQSLLGNFEFANEDTDAYKELSTKIGTGLARQFSPQLQGSAGVSFEVYRTEDNTGTHDYRLFGFPMTLRYDGSDNLLDPTEGYRLGGALTPYVGEADGSAAAFSKFEIIGTNYWSFGKQPDLTLAFRGRYGLMLAQDTVDVPGSLRFYAGGGGSIRGYGYQLVGPLDASNDPEGGRSVVEGSAEARWRVSRDFGLVAFVDTGNAYSTSVPKPSKGLQWGAGVGLRYYTPIGPVRADIAVPLNKRKSVDDDFQVYFSLGQAF